MKVEDSPRVLHIVHSLGMGGAETWLLELIRHARKFDKDFPIIDIFVTSGKKDLFDDEAKSLGSNIYYVKLDKDNIINFIIKFRKILINNNYTAIHDHQEFLSGWHFLFGIGLLPKVRIAHVHNPSYQLVFNYGVTKFRKLKQRLGKFFIKYLSTDVAGTSLQVLKEYGIIKKRYPKQWIGALHCSFLLEQWDLNNITAKQELCEELGLSLNTKVILFAGRLDYSIEINHPQNHKNSVFALKVFQNLSTENVVLLYAGANDYIKDKFVSLIQENGLENQVFLLGIRKDIRKLMAASDLLFFPSRAEGLGMVAVEAQASGLC